MTAAASTAGRSTSPSRAGCAPPRSRWPASTSPGSPPASATATRCCPGTTSTPAWTSNGSGTTGRTRWRVRAGRLPVDAVLRLRRLLQSGHRHPGRPDRTRAAAARRQVAGPGTRQTGRDGPPRSGRTAATAGRPAAARALREAWSAAVHLAPRLRARVRTGAAPRRGTDGRTRRVSRPIRRSVYVGAAPTGVASEAEYLEIGLAQRTGRRGGCGALSTRRCRTVWTSSRSSRPARARWPSACEASHWRVELPGVSTDALHEAIVALLACPQLSVQRLTKDGRRDVDVRVAIVSAVAESASAAASGDSPCDTGHGRPAGNPGCSARRRPRRVADRRRSRPRTHRRSRCAWRRDRSTRQGRSATRWPPTARQLGLRRSSTIQTGRQLGTSATGPMQTSRVSRRGRPPQPPPRGRGACNTTAPGG